MSRYSTYADFISDIAQEAGESGSDLDSLILNLLKSVVDQLNLIRAPFREASASPTIVQGTYQYLITDFASDYNEPIHSKNALRFTDVSGQTLVPIVKQRADFLSGWDTSSQGKPSLARIFAGYLQLRPTPDSAYTMVLEYYKNFATPTSGGTVLIPDQYLTLARMEILKRMEAYNESDNFSQKLQVFGSIRNETLAAINRDFQQNSLPSDVEVLDEQDY